MKWLQGERYGLSCGDSNATGRSLRRQTHCQTVSIFGVTEWARAGGWAPPLPASDLRRRNGLVAAWWSGELAGTTGGVCHWIHSGRRLTGVRSGLVPEHIRDYPQYYCHHAYHQPDWYLFILHQRHPLFSPWSSIRCPRTRSYTSSRPSWLPPIS